MAVTLIADIVREHAAQRPDKAAVVYGDRSLTYGDLNTRSSRLANALRAEGIGEQDRVALLDKNSPEFYELVFATTKLNAVSVPVNWRLNPREAAYIINDAEVKVLIVGEEFLPVLDAMESGLTTAKKIVIVGRHDRHQPYEDWLAEHDASDPGVATTADDVALQLYSSGTTGLPKGVMLTNANCAAFLRTTHDLVGLSSDSVSLVAMPLFHVAGGLWALLGAYDGATAVLERDVNPPRFVTLMGEQRITHAVLVPAVLQLMLTVPGVAEADFSSLEYILYGASPISEEVLKGSMRTFGCKFSQVYGMTETCAGVTALPAEDHDLDGSGAHRLRSAGKPIADYGVRIADPETLEGVELGGVGEILIKSPQNMKGYWKLPEETERTLLRGGWLRTGDAGYLDADGYVYIHDRVKDMIISGGENIYPAEVENVLMSHPGVADVAVIGIPSDTWGETPIALVVKAPDSEPCSEDELIEFARANLAHYKCPTSVEWIGALPRNPSGKILKRDLRAPYWEGRERKVN